MKLKTDSIQFYRQFFKNTAVEFILAYIQKKLKHFKNPSRKDTRKGDPIGHSLGWMRAVILMALYPQLRIREIARMVPTSPKVVEAWRSKKDFQEEVAKSEQELSENISHTLQEIFKECQAAGNELPRRKQRGINWNIFNFLAASGGELTPERIRFKGIRSSAKYLLAWAGVLAYLSPSIGAPIIKDIGNQFMKDPEDSLRAAFLSKVHEFCAVRTRKDKRKWEKDHLETTVAAISGGFDSLSKKYSKDKIFLRSFKNYILDVIQGLAWGR